MLFLTHPIPKSLSKVANASTIKGEAVFVARYPEVHKSVRAWVVGAKNLTYFVEVIHEVI